MLVSVKIPLLFFRRLPGVITPFLLLPHRIARTIILASFLAVRSAPKSVLFSRPAFFHHRCYRLPTFTESFLGQDTTIADEGKRRRNN